MSTDGNRKRPMKTEVVESRKRRSTCYVSLFFFRNNGQSLSSYCSFIYIPGFQPFFTTSAISFCQEGDVPTIKILLKNTKSMHVYYDFFHGVYSSQYEYMSRPKLETEE